MPGHARLLEVEHLHRRELLQFAHDLRNLILGILGSAELLAQSDGLSAVQRRQVETILGQIERIQCLADDILWLGHGSGSHYPVNICSLAKEVASRVEFDRKMPIRYQCSTNGNVLVGGNEPRLWRALYNLVLNASEAAGASGKVVVRISQEKNGQCVAVAVEDNGPGIPSNIRENIFSPFFTTKPSHSGLGLSLAKNVIDDHHGTISTRSKDARGTIFTIQLPTLKKHGADNSGICG